MTEVMSGERLAWLRRNNEPLGDHGSSLTADEVGELLAEVDRLRDQLAAANERADTAEALWSARTEAARQREETWRDSAMRDRAELEKALARLAEIGEPEAQYGLQYGTSDPQVLRDEGQVTYYKQQRHTGLRVREAYASQWRPAPEAGCRSCGTTERVLGDPPLCSNCAVYGSGFATGGIVSGPLHLPDGDGPASYVMLPRKTLEQLTAEQGIQPIVNISDLAAAPETRLSDEEYATFMANIASLRGKPADAAADGQDDTGK